MVPPFFMPIAALVGLRTVVQDAQDQMVRNCFVSNQDRFGSEKIVSIGLK